MSGGGLHFAVSVDTVKQLKLANEVDTIVGMMSELKEERDEAYLAETGRAWNAIHRALTDGQLDFGNGKPPLNQCVLGSRQLYPYDEYIVCLATPQQVKAAATALDAIDADAFRERYTRLVPADYAPEYGDEDREYTTKRFLGMRDLYLRAAQEGRGMVFTLDR